MKKLIIATVGILSLVLGSNAVAVPIVIDFEATPNGVFFTSPLSLDGFTFTVDAGHYDIFDRPGTTNNYFNIDHVSYGLTTITLTRDGGGLFDVLSMDVITAATFADQFNIFAIGAGGNISAPLSMGLFNFGAGFQGINALVFAQNSAGYFGFDDLTLRAVPEPGTLALFGIGLMGMALARRKKDA